VCYGLYDGDNIVGFCAVIHQPHVSNAKIKRISRIVILPDYQGIGLGYRFLCVVAEHYAKMGFDVSITTSAKNFIHKLNASKSWQLCRYSTSRHNKGAMSNKTASFQSAKRTNCKTASFFYTK